VERCAGLDWAKDAHQMCVLEGDGEPLLQRSFTHDERDLDGLCELLVESEVKRVAIERPDGVLVERLLEAGLIVLPIHPNQLKAARPRFRASGGKSDSFDAFSAWQSSPAPTTAASGSLHPTRTRQRL
jgi:Transposase